MMLHTVRKSASRCLIGTFLVLTGYMLAIISFRQEVWVDFHSGARKTTWTLFPFSVSKDNTNDAFWMLFGRSEDGRADWGIVERKHFVDITNTILMRKVGSNTAGGGLVVTENTLVLSLLLREGCNKEQRLRMSDQFYTALREHGEVGASEYVESLYMKVLEGRNKGTDNKPGHRHK
jgi:hypothetical protein